MSAITLEAVRMGERDVRDEEEGVTRIVRAVDNTVSIAWRWASILTTLISAGFVIGVVVTNANATKDAFNDFKQEIRGRLDSQGQQYQNTVGEVKELKAQLEARGREIDDRRTKDDIRDTYINQLRERMTIVEMSTGLKGPKK